MDIRELQRQAAVYVDELLSISVDMDAYVIEAYGKAPQEVVAMQCRIQLERLKRLEKKLVKIREELARATGPEDGLEGARSVQPESGEAGEPQGTCAETARQAGRMESPGARSSAERLSGEQRRSLAAQGRHPSSQGSASAQFLSRTDRNPHFAKVPMIALIGHLKRY